MFAATLKKRRVFPKLCASVSSALVLCLSVPRLQVLRSSVLSALVLSASPLALAAGMPDHGDERALLMTLVPDYSGYSLVGVSVERGHEYFVRHDLRRAQRELDLAIDVCHSELGMISQKVYAARSEGESLHYLYQAESTLQDAITVEPSCADALFYRGMLSFSQGHMDEAEVFILDALDMSPQHPIYLSAHAQLLQAREQWQGALEIYRRAEDAAVFHSPANVRNSELAVVKHGIARSYMQLQNYVDAEQIYRECLVLNDGDEVAKQNLARLAERAKQQAETPSITLSSY